MAGNAHRNKVPYEKPTSISEDLIQKLRERGLLIRDEHVAENALRFIGYYRLRGYFYPFYRMTTERVPRRLNPNIFCQVQLLRM